MRRRWIGVTLALAGCAEDGNGEDTSASAQTSTSSGSTTAATTSTGDATATTSSGTAVEVTTAGATTSGTTDALDESSTGATAAGDTSTDASSTGGASWSGPCPAYSGMAPVGSTWDLSSTPQYEASTGNSFEIDRVVTQVQDLGTHTRVTIVSTTPSTTPDSSLTSVQTWAYRCDDDGAWLESLYQEIDGTIAGQPWSAWTDSTYQPALLTMPWDVDVGSTWSASTTVVTTSSNAPVAQSDFSADYQAVGTATAHPPAGDFDGLAISWTDGTNVGSWIAHPEIGLVESEGSSSELVDVGVLPW